MPADAFWRQVQQRIGDGQEVARTAVGAHNAFASGLADALQAWQKASANAMTSSGTTGAPDAALRAMAEPWERVVAAFTPPAAPAAPGRTTKTGKSGASRDV